MAYDHPALNRLRDGQWSLERTREYLAHQPRPLIEEAGPSAVDVTFVLDTDQPGTVRVMEKVSWRSDEERTLESVAGTPIHALTWRMRPDLRFTYGFEVGGRLMPDPANPPPGTDPRLIGSICTLPRAPQYDIIPGPPCDRVEEVSFPDPVFGGERTLWVSTPPGWSETGGPYSFVLEFDGAPGFASHSLRDQLAERGLIRDLVIVSIDQRGNRDRELPAIAAFTDMLADDLIPFLVDRYSLSTDPADAGLSGKSYGGLCAGWSALHRPDAFGAAHMQSPSCWYHPALGANPDIVGEDAPVPTLIADYLERPRAPIRIFHECGRFEFGPPMAQIWQTFANRWLCDILTSKDYAYHYREYPGGHDAAWWTSTWATGIAALFPPRRLAA